MEISKSDLDIINSYPEELHYIFKQTIQAEQLLINLQKHQPSNNKLYIIPRKVNTNEIIIRFPLFDPVLSILVVGDHYITSMYHNNRLISNDYGYDSNPKLIDNFDQLIKEIERVAMLVNNREDKIFTLSF